MRKGKPSRNASHTTPLTIAAELGVIGLALYLWLLGATGWAIYRIARMDRTLGVGLAAVLGTLVVHSLLYAGFFEDPLTWGVIGLAAAVLSRARVTDAVADITPDPASPTPELLAD